MRLCRDCGALQWLFLLDLLQCHGKERALLRVDFFLLSFASEQCYLGKAQIPVLMQPYRSCLGCSSHRIAGWDENLQHSLVICLAKSSGTSLKSICFMIQSPAMQTHTHVSK